MISILRKRIYGALKEMQKIREVAGNLICRKSLFLSGSDKIEFQLNPVRSNKQKTNNLNNDSVTNSFKYQFDGFAN